ncbi:MAG: hypothetical protein ACI9OD_004925 [Limisphaerales bacterium]|jgi:hypothetical protein
MKPVTDTPASNPGTMTENYTPPIAPYLLDSETPGWETPDEPPPLTPHLSLRKRSLLRVCSATEWVFGMATIIVGLAIAAVIPIVNFISLGYLLEVSGRVARTGRFTEGFIGARPAAKLGSVVIGTWICFLPVRIVAGLWRDAVLLAEGSAIEKSYGVAVVLLTVFTVWHVIWACLRGGRLRSFAWPAPISFIRWLKVPDKFTDIQNVVVKYINGMNIPYFFWLGARGFAGAFALLFVPVSIMVVGTFFPPAGAAVFAFLGGAGLLFVVLYLPFLQTRFACENRLGAMFEIREIRKLFKRAPLAFWLAFLITLLFALPLYLLKVEFPPKDIAWLPTLVFVIFIFPARLLTGWAMSLATKREKDGFFLFRWLSRLTIVPIAGFYVIFVYVSQYFSWHGAFSLFEQHAFLVPYPMFSI